MRMALAVVAFLVTLAASIAHLVENDFVQAGSVANVFCDYLPCSSSPHLA